MSIGERISSLRKEQNISQGQLADALGVSRQAVSKWENDQSSPDTLKLIRLADILDTGVEYLATGKEPTPLSPSPIVPKMEESALEPVQPEPVIQHVVEYVTVEKIVEKPIIRKRIRIKYVRSPVEFGLVGVGFFVFGLIVGLIL